MSQDSNVSPLLVLVRLTEEQRRQIQQQAGVTLNTVPFATAAPEVRCEFGGITLRVVRGVFMPAAATERLLESALNSIVGYPAPVVVEIGSGCGAIALAVAAARPDAVVHATDLSETALHCARRNRTRLGIRNVRFRQGSLLAPVPRTVRGKAAAVIANLPYVPPHFHESMSTAFPAGTAIGMGEDGLDLVRQLAAGARDFLIAGGSLLLQLADFQWEGFARELTALGYEQLQLSTQMRSGPVAGRIIWPG